MLLAWRYVVVKNNLHGALFIFGDHMGSDPASGSFDNYFKKLHTHVLHFLLLLLV